MKQWKGREQEGLTEQQKKMCCLPAGKDSKNVIH
jgi:hypothetical protein